MQESCTLAACFLMRLGNRFLQSLILLIALLPVKGHLYNLPAQKTTSLLLERRD